MRATKLYRHFAEDGTLLYIGVSSEIGRRQAKHLWGSPWANQIARIEIENYPTREAALLAEKTAVTAEKPLHNRHLKRTGPSVMLSARIPEKLLREINDAASEDDISRSETVMALLEIGLAVREST